MHTAALAELGLAKEWSYVAIEVAPEDFDEQVRAMPGEGFVGANVTVPHKLAALAVADDASQAARAIGAANTLSFAHGRIAAENTDATGLLDALPESPADARAIVLGAGGSARAVVWALVDAGGDVWIWNRTPEKAEGLARELGASATETVDVADFDLLVNATTVGMGASTQASTDLKSLPIDADALGERHQLVDLAYGTADTELDSRGKSAGSPGRRRVRGAGPPGGSLAPDLDRPRPADRGDAAGGPFGHMANENRPGYLRPVPSGDEATAGQLEDTQQAG